MPGDCVDVVDHDVAVADALVHVVVRAPGRGRGRRVPQSVIGLAGVLLIVEHALVGEIAGLAVGGGDDVVAGAEVGHIPVGRDVGGVGIERVEVFAGLLGGFEYVVLCRLPLGNHIEEIARGERSGTGKQQNVDDFFHVARILEIILKAEFHHALATGISNRCRCPFRGPST